MRNLLVALTLVLFCGAAVAQDDTNADLTARIIAGIADGAEMSLGDITNARVKRIRPGVFLFLATDGKSKSLYTFREPEPCLILVSVKQTPPQTGIVRLDVTKIDSVEVEDRSAGEGIPALRIRLASSRTAAAMIMEDGSEQPLTDLTTNSNTTVTRDEILAAADTLLARCREPQPEVPISDGAVGTALDLMAAIVTGLADGAHVALGREGIAVRTGPGAFEIRGTDGSAGPVVTVTEVSSCLFELTFRIPGGEPDAMQFNANLIESYVFRPEDGAPFGLNGFTVVLEGGEGMVNRVTSAGLEPATDTEGNLVTSLDQNQLEASAVAFQSNYCPGPGA